MVIPYYFLKNLQGDVIAIANSKGKVVASYTYDAWGVCTIVSDNTGMIARINPFRYRSYYFDEEIGLYYLQSRYYDAETGRFVNADKPEISNFSHEAITHNLMAYVGNDPINQIDFFGFFSFADIVGGIDKILGYLKDAFRVLLEGFGISLRKYKKTNKYKNSASIQNFVFKNKNKIKSLRNSVSDIAYFVEIVIIVIECCKMINVSKNSYKAMAEILFYGFLKLVTFGFTKLVSFILRKVIFFLKFIIEKVLYYLFDKFLGPGSSNAKKLKSCYMDYINNSRMDFFDYIIALFKGMGKAVTC